MKRSVLAAIALSVTFTFAGDARAESTLKVINESGFDIHHVFVSPTSQNEWGPDLLGDHTLVNGQTLNINGIDCDDYDIRVVDEDGDECIVTGAELCEGTYWQISHDDLLECEGFGDAGDDHDDDDDDR